VLSELRAAPPWAPRPLAADGATARVALVQTAATLLGGDRCALEVRLGPGARLELVETGATVAHDARGGAAAQVHVRIELATGARLTWLARPLVLAAGCAVTRETTVALADGAVALLRETVVLGRSGEQPGALTATFRATHAARPLLHERLDTTPPPAGAPRLTHPLAATPSLPSDPRTAPPPTAAAPLRSPLVAGDATTIDAVMLLGARGAELPGSTQLAGPGTLWRALHPRDSDPDGPALAVAQLWQNE
jgi:urease accessory protein